MLLYFTIYLIPGSATVTSYVDHATDRSYQTVSVQLRVVNFEDPHPTRNFILKSPTYAIRIGRGSKSGNRELFPPSTMRGSSRVSCLGNTLF